MVSVIKLFSVVAPVPPRATVNVPVVPATIGSPVIFVAVPLAGVPNTGVVNVGAVKVLFVKVCVASNTAIVSLTFGKDSVLSAVGSITVNIVS